MNRINYGFSDHTKINLLKKILIILGTLLFLLTSILDYILVPDRIFTSLKIRYLITSPFFFLTLYFAFKRDQKEYYPAIIALIAPITALSAMASMFLIGGNLLNIYPLGILFTITWVYLICLGISIRIPLAYNCLIVISFIIVDIMHLHFPPQYRFSYLFFMIGFSFLGYVTTDLINKTIKTLNEKEQSLLKARKETQEAYVKKTNAFINLAHETKTPLTLINNYFNRYKKLQEPSHELNIIQENLNRLERDMIHFLKLEKELKHPQIEVIEDILDLSRFIQEETVLLEDYFQTKGLNLEKEIESSIFVNLCTKDCEHIVYNLLENAYKYSDPCSKVSIKLKKMTDTTNVLSVLNFGEIIPIEQQNDIFLPYKQSDALRNHNQGLGMGLAIVKNILDKIGASIEVQSHSIKGTEFTILFKSEKPITSDKTTVQELKKPLYFPSEIIYSENGTIDYDSSQKSILVIENDTHLLNFLIEELGTLYNVYSARNGMQSLSMLENDIPSPSLIISDVMMDEMNGLDFLYHFRQNSSLPHPPLIFLSADDSEESRMKGLILGAIDYIRKPFSIDELKQKIQTWLGLFSEGLKGAEEREIFSNIQIKYSLSSREVQVFYLLIKGESRIRIADKLYISINTVKSHINSIYSKCRITNRTDMRELIDLEIEEKINPTTSKSPFWGDFILLIPI